MEQQYVDRIGEKWFERHQHRSPAGAGRSVPASSDNRGAACDQDYPCRRERRLGEQRSHRTRLPVLVSADSVLVTTVGDDNNSDVPSILDHPAWHGITATHRHLTAGSSGSTGVRLLNMAISHGERRSSAA